MQSKDSRLEDLFVVGCQGKHQISPPLFLSSACSLHAFYIYVFTKILQMPTACKTEKERFGGLRYLKETASSFLALTYHSPQTFIKYFVYVFNQTWYMTN